jgi:hypothetical protein
MFTFFSIDTLLNLAATHTAKTIAKKLVAFAPLPELKESHIAISNVALCIIMSSIISPEL